MNVQFVQRLARLDTWVFVASRLLTLCAALVYLEQSWPLHYFLHGTKYWNNLDTHSNTSTRRENRILLSFNRHVWPCKSV